METQSTPQLEAPGAGLPKMELFMMKRCFPLMCRFSSRESLNNLFTTEFDELLRIVSTLSEKEARQQVLIKRIRSIEDSSRYWSAYMTLHHLHLVNLGISGIIRSLTRGEKIDQIVKIENVKPDPAIGPEVIETFKKSAGILRRICAAIEDLNIDATHHHPWFGQLNPRGWHALTAIHMRIHRKQMDLIAEGLTANAVPVL